MSTQATKKQVLLMNDQPETLPLLVRALEAEGYQVIVALTFCDALTWLEVETPRCLIVYRPTLSAPDLAVLCAHRLWAKRVPLVVVTSVPAPAALRRTLEGRNFSVIPLFVSPDVLCQLVVTLTSQEEPL
jgi:DNA-binding response OmpR family regulator